MNKPITKLIIPIRRLGGSMGGSLEIDVRELGFLSTEELMRDPDHHRYIKEAVDAAMKKRRLSDK